MKNKKKNKIKFKLWYSIIIGFANIIDGLSMILSLGYYVPALYLKLSLWGATKKIYKNNEN